jgi:hypothetical protein
MAKTRQESDWFTALAKRANLAFAAIGFVLVGVLVVLGTVFDERLKEMETSLDVAPMTTAPFDSPLVTTTPTEMPATVVSGQTLYVPAYSHIQHVENRIYLLAVNLSVRNTDASHPITVATVDFYDTNGELVRSYVDSPQELGPLALRNFRALRRPKREGQGCRTSGSVWHSRRELRRGLRRTGVSEGPTVRLQTT